MEKLTIIAAALLLAACTTQFDTGRDGDASTDTPVESTADGTDVPDGADTLPDVEPDAPPPGHVECLVERDVYVMYGGGTRVEWGCPTTDECRDTDFWMGFVRSNLVVISGAERTSMSESGGFFASAVRITGDAMTSDGAQEITISYPDGYHPRYRNAAPVLEHHDELILLYPVAQWGSGGVLTDQFVNALVVEADDSGSLGWDARQFMSELSATGESDPINHIRAIRQGDDVHVFYAMEHDIMMGPAPTQMYGGTVLFEEIAAGAVFDHEDAFRPLQPTRDDIDFPHSPTIAQGRVVLPMMRMVLTGIRGDYHSSAWAFDGPIPASGAHDVMDFESTSSFDGAMAAAGLGPDGDLAAAVLASDTQFTMTGMDPPYVLNVAVSGSPDDEVLEGGRVTNVNESSFREMDSFDLKDPKIFYDDVMGIFHYVIVLYPAGRNATVYVYSFFPDGTPAMEGTAPFTFETGSNTMPAYDAVMSPGTGRIYVAVYPGDGISGSADGYYVSEIACDLITE